MSLLCYQNKQSWAVSEWLMGQWVGWRLALKRDPCKMFCQHKSSRQMKNQRKNNTKVIFTDNKTCKCGQHKSPGVKDQPETWSDLWLKNWWIRVVSNRSITQRSITRFILLFNTDGTHNFKSKQKGLKSTTRTVNSSGKRKLQMLWDSEESSPGGCLERMQILYLTSIFYMFYTFIP